MMNGVLAPKLSRTDRVLRARCELKASRKWASQTDAGWPVPVT